MGWMGGIHCLGKTPEKLCTPPTTHPPTPCHGFRTFCFFLLQNYEASGFKSFDLVFKKQKSSESRLIILIEIRLTSPFWRRGQNLVVYSQYTIFMNWHTVSPFTLTLLVSLESNEQHAILQNQAFQKEDLHNLRQNQMAGRVQEVNQLVKIFRLHFNLLQTHIQLQKTTSSNFTFPYHW